MAPSTSREVHKYSCKGPWGKIRLLQGGREARGGEQGREGEEEVRKRGIKNEERAAGGRGIRQWASWMNEWKTRVESREGDRKRKGRCVKEFGE